MYVGVERIGLGVRLDYFTVLQREGFNYTSSCDELKAADKALETRNKKRRNKDA